MSATATVQIIFQNEDGWHHVYCETDGDTLGEARSAAEFVLRTMALDKLAYIRNAPEAETEKTFDTKTLRHKGWCRFSFKNEPGEWHHPQPISDDQNFGLAPNNGIWAP